MKQFFLILAMVIISQPAFTQLNPSLFNQLTDKYADQEGFSASLLTSDMFDLYLKKKNLEEPSPVFDALKDLDRIIVISKSKLMSDIQGSEITTGVKQNNNQLHETILDYYKKNNYTLFKTEKRMGEDVKVYLKKDQDRITSLALISNSSTSTNAVELLGNIDLKTVAELNKALNLKGLENLYKLDNSNAWGVGLPRIEMEELMARQREMVERQRNLTDEQRKQFEVQAQLQAEKQMQMAEKYREMAEKYQREPIFLSYPGDTNTVYFIDGKKVKAKQIKELNKEIIESIEVKKPEKDDDKTTIIIKTK